jgi:hypothetical protein
MDTFLVIDPDLIGAVIGQIMAKLSEMLGITWFIGPVW